MRKRVIIVILLLTCFFLVGCEKKEEKEKSKQPEQADQEKAVGEPTITFSDEQVEIVDGSQMEKMLAILNEFGRPIYREQKYEGYGKMSGMYFIPLKDLNKDFGLDLTPFVDEQGNVCDPEKSGILFDIDDVSKIGYDKDFLPILPVLVGCQ